MKSVWAHFRRVAIPGRTFDRKLFADVLRFIWKGARVRLDAERARRVEIQVSQSAAPEIVCAPARPMSEMEARIDGLKYLSARYRIDLMEREIRAEYAHA